ncbi:hypothetical protein QQ045_015464 [Rhodiola kirilowii]
MGFILDIDLNVKLDEEDPEEDPDPGLVKTTSKSHLGLSAAVISKFSDQRNSPWIDYDDVPSFLPARKFFINEEFRAYKVACVLSGFGFAWNRLGRLYKDEAWIFDMEPEELSNSLLCLKSFGFQSAAVTGMCLAFPELLRSGSESRNVDGMLSDLKKVNDLVRFVHNDADKCIKYFCRLDVEKKDVVMLLHQIPEILSFDLETRHFSVLEFLKHFGMSVEELDLVKQKFPYVLGWNKMANLPSVMKAMDRQKWFFSQLKNGSHELLSTYVMKEPMRSVRGFLSDELGKGLTTVGFARH